VPVDECDSRRSAGDEHRQGPNQGELITTDHEATGSADVMTRLPTWFRWGSRLRGVASTGGVLAIFIGTLAPLEAAPAIWFGGVVALSVGLALCLHPGGPRIAPRPISSPVSGRWVAYNSPVDGLPSHRTHGYGQTYAIDLVYEPESGGRPKFGNGPVFRPANDFPGFGQPIRAPADGRVVAVRNSARDHGSRSSWVAYAFMWIEGMVRELAGQRHLLGNYVILDLGDSCYAALVHLQRGSVTVRPGDEVHRYDVIGRCGNSGHSSEPHLHLQVMDHPWPLVAAGLPFTFVDVEIGKAGTTTGLPANEEAMNAAQPVPGDWRR